MPGMDGTGPIGMGPLSGRGLGTCGRGFRMGAGRGMGFRRFSPAQQSYEPIVEETALKADREAMKAELGAIEKRLKELEAKK